MCSWKNSRLLIYPIFSVTKWIYFFPYDLKFRKNRMTAVLNPIRLRLTLLLYAVFVGFTAFQILNNKLERDFRAILVFRRRFMQIDLIIFVLNSAYWYILRPDLWQSVLDQLDQINALLGQVKYSPMHAMLMYFEFSLLIAMFVGGIWMGDSALETVLFCFFHTVFCSFAVQLFTGLMMVVRDQFAELNRRIVLAKRLENCVTIHADLIKIVRDIYKLHRVMLLIYIAELFLFITTLIYDIFKSYTTNLTETKVALKILPVFLVRQCSHIWSIGYVASSVKRHSSEFTPLLSHVMRSLYYPCFDTKLKLYVAVAPAVKNTAFGFFQVSNLMLGSLLVTAATYFIALLQVI